MSSHLKSTSWKLKMSESTFESRPWAFQGAFMGVFSFVGSQDTTTSKSRKMRKRDSLMVSMKITHLKLQKNTCYRNEFSSIVRNKSFHVISVHCNDPCSLIQEISDFKKSTFLTVCIHICSNLSLCLNFIYVSFIFHLYFT